MDHTIALIKKSHEGDKEARAQLVEENTGLVWCIVKRFYNRGAEAEDLFQIGSIGLLKAIDKFDLSYDVKFSTYAVPMISGEIKRFLRDDGMIKVSRSLKELACKAFSCQEGLRRKLGREPLLAEIAAELKVDKEELAAAMEASAEVESLHKTIYQKDGHEISLMDKLEEQETGEDKVVDHMLLSELLKALNGEERKLIYLRYFAGRTQSDVGKILGVSQVQVSRMEKKILGRLREKL
ncbi:SigF/SigG family RNA polymerase sporulation sigma factor [Dorea acetigenes]|uniref:RNA polymerase sigma factor n=1 Tax=Dorea acetigenes TaxID=2981787 RepID=A0ABT2RIE9_9FIRM|nr:SigF/SigG family RNA polymerase sporulation sigma factor [Dorea acetigenes]MCB6415280.1 SigF/SigG family RNA polymerase sporulation sigma factor [Faecalimonas umbilicata]MCU6685009.1 SigF/SigG family RNA polymerase sporulation sigma factor [Dorea acetigenes]SCI34040.1 Stage II sporulation protein AC [uncultured Clostridium sp.]